MIATTDIQIYSMEKGNLMLSESQVRLFANDWQRAWNSHDLDAILSHDVPEIVLISSTAARLLNDPSGTVAGEVALRDYFRRGLEAYPNLAFELVDVMCEFRASCFITRIKMAR